MYPQKTIKREEEASRRSLSKVTKTSKEMTVINYHRRADELAKNMDKIRNISTNEC